MFSANAPSSASRGSKLVNRSSRKDSKSSGFSPGKTTSRPVSPCLSAFTETFVFPAGVHKKILESLLATGAFNRREGVNRLTVDTKWFARADARARASRAEVGRRERVREASGCSNSEHARSIRNVRKAIRDFNSSDLAIFRHHESGQENSAFDTGLLLFVADELPPPAKRRQRSCAMSSGPPLHRPRAHLCGRFTLTRSKIRPCKLASTWFRTSRLQTAWRQCESESGFKM